jgi:hypothetical protein
MTIAAGFVCVDGILIGADTQQTVSDSHKFDRSKVRRDVDHIFGNYVVAGSGNTSYIGMCGDMIEAAFCRNGSLAEKDTEKEREHRIRELVYAEIRRVHEHMRACHHEGDWLASLELLLAIQGANFQPILFHIETDGGVSRIRSGEIFIGAGSAVATAFARILCGETLDLELTKWLAFFILYQAKFSGYGCGGSTEQFRLPQRTPWRAGVYDERGIAEHVESAMRLSLMDARNPAVSKEQLNRRLAELSAALSAIKASSERPDWTPFILESIRAKRSKEEPENQK